METKELQKWCEEWLEPNGIKYKIEGSNLFIDGDLDISSTEITCLPDNLTISGNLDLFGTKITSTPYNLTVGGWVDLNNSYIKHISDGLNVGGSLYLINTNVESISNDLVVGFDLCISTNKKHIHIPQTVIVKNRININYK